MLAAAAPTHLRAQAGPPGTPTIITRHRVSGAMPTYLGERAGAAPSRNAPSMSSPDDRAGRHRDHDAVDRASSDSEFIDASTAHRAGAVAAENRYSASPVVRTALSLLDGTCRFPGCGRRADRCELDHTKAWSEGGRTTPANLAHLCSRHHHLKHEGGWKVLASRDGTRTLTWLSPRGSTYITTPESHSFSNPPLPHGVTADLPHADEMRAPTDSAGFPTLSASGASRHPTRSGYTGRDEPPPF
ncbi:HNH endonuclease [Herbiconiux sp. SALV-R1]|nr:HNH endonuclease [Herbiconiux sp. SALV-R1]